MRVAVEDLAVRAGRVELVAGVDLVAESGEFVGLVGPNGSGKSTVLKTLYRANRAVRGTIWLGADRLADLEPRAVACRVAALTQEHAVEFGFTVLEVVQLGLTPHKRVLEADTDADRAHVRDCLRLVGIERLADREFPSLSGGEKQRVLLATALVQRPRVLVLDELTNHLDIAAQLSLLDLLRGLGVTVITALHDLNLALHYCDRVHLIQSGRVVATGRPFDVLSDRACIRAVFGVEARLGTDPVSGSPHLFFSLPITKEPV